MKYDTCKRKVVKNPKVFLASKYEYAGAIIGAWSNKK